MGSDGWHSGTSPVVEDVSPEGLTLGHAYTVTEARQLDAGHLGLVQLIRIRNPWANDVEWTGKFSLLLLPFLIHSIAHKWRLVALIVTERSWRPHISGFKIIKLYNLITFNCNNTWLFVKYLIKSFKKIYLLYFSTGSSEARVSKIY